jgi:hypothetical protein
MQFSYIYESSTRPNAGEDDNSKHMPSDGANIWCMLSKILMHGFSHSDSSFIHLLLLQNIDKKEENNLFSTESNHQHSSVCTQKPTSRMPYYIAEPYS